MFKAGVDYFMDPHNSFSLSGNIGFGHHPTSGTQNTAYQDGTGSIDSSGQRSSYESDRFVFSHSNFDYTHSFSKTNEKLSASAALETYHGTDNGNYAMQYLDKGATPLGDPYRQQFSGFGDARNLTLQTDYTDPFKDGNAKLETGIKTTLHHNHSFNDFRNEAGQNYVPDSSASYNYQYDDNTYAAYASYSDQFGKFSYMAGLRLEKYDYTGRLLDDNSGFGFHQTGLYPSLYLTEKTGENSDIHLNYSRRVNRPQWWQITPETNYSNPQNPQMGNPHIRPENTNLVELAYNNQFGGGIGLNTTLYVKNTLSPMMSYNIPLSKDTLLSTFENGNSINTYGAEIIFKLPVTKWWNATTNFNLYETDINADNLSHGISDTGLS